MKHINIYSSKLAESKFPIPKLKNVQTNSFKFKSFMNISISKSGPICLIGNSSFHFYLQKLKKLKISFVRKINYN